MAERTDHIADVAAIGAGAAGLFAAIHAARAATESGAPARVVAIDSAPSLGAKILIAGGGRCNVTHFEVDAGAYAGSSRNAIGKVLRSFGVAETVAFFRAQGVELKREETGKLFPTSDSARDVLDALLRAAHAAGVHLLHPWRVDRIEPLPDEPGARATAPRFRIVRARSGSDGPEQPAILARRVIVATGGKSLPKTGSDGHGYAIASALGHSITPRVFPALVPLLLPKEHFLCSLSGIALPATLEVRSATGKRLVSFTNSLLFTHFGLSGPCALDVSRYYTDARLDDPNAALFANLLPALTPEALDERLRGLGSCTPLSLLRDLLPERVARALLDHGAIDPHTPGAQLSKEKRRALVAAATALALPIIGDRGFAYAEVTAGGVPLSEIRLDTMESRVCPGLHLCGEICDVDGRIGGFNFQWAWASGYLAGRGAAAALADTLDRAKGDDA